VRVGCSAPTPSARSTALEAFPLRPLVSGRSAAECVLLRAVQSGYPGGTRNSDLLVSRTIADKKGRPTQNAIRNKGISGSLGSQDNPIWKSIIHSAIQPMSRMKAEGHRLVGHIFPVDNSPDDYAVAFDLEYHSKVSTSEALNAK